MMVGRRNHDIRVWDNSKGIVAMDGDPNRPDQHCVAQFGDSQCKLWAKEQNAPATFIDELAHGGVNVTLYGKLHTGAGLDRYPGVTDAFPFDGVPTPQRRLPSDGSRKVGGYWSRAALIEKPPPSSSILEKLTVPDDVPMPLTPRDYRTVDHCVAALADGLLARGRPQQFLYCSILVPHPPYKSNATYMAQVDASLVEPPAWGAVGEVHPADRHMIIQKGEDGIDSVSNTVIDHFRHVYYSRCAAADALIGQILTQFERSGDVENTYVVFISDHGESNTEHRMTGKNSMYEASARVPMIIAGPGIVPRTIIHSVASLFDIYPTVLDMAGLSARAPAKLPGSSVLPLAQGRAAPGRKDYVVSEYHSYYSATGTFMIRRGEHKLIVFGEDKVFGQAFPPLLFNLASDPQELHNIAPTSPRVTEALQALLAEEVDVEAADSLCKEDNKANFRQFFYEPYGGADRCMKIMGLVFEGFNSTDAAKLEKWLGEPCRGSAVDTPGIDAESTEEGESVREFLI